MLDHAGKHVQFPLVRSNYMRAEPLCFFPCRLFGQQIARNHSVSMISIINTHGMIINWYAWLVCLDMSLRFATWQVSCTSFNGAQSPIGRGFFSLCSHSVSALTFKRKGSKCWEKENKTNSDRRMLTDRLTDGHTYAHANCSSLMCESPKEPTTWMVFAFSCECSDLCLVGLGQIMNSSAKKRLHPTKCSVFNINGLQTIGLKKPFYIHSTHIHVNGIIEKTSSAKISSTRNRGNTPCAKWAAGLCLRFRSKLFSPFFLNGAPYRLESEKPQYFLTHIRLPGIAMIVADLGAQSLSRQILAVIPYRPLAPRL